MEHIVVAMRGEVEGVGLVVQGDGEAHREIRLMRPSRDRDAPAAPDLVDRDFTASGPDALWVADITYVPTGSGFLYLAVVLDAWSRRVVGGAMASHLRTKLVVQALDMALWQRRPEGVGFITRTKGVSIRRWPSGAVAGRPECGRRRARSATATTTPCVRASSPPSSVSCSNRRCFPTHAVARREIFDYIEAWYNRHRRHSALNYESPMNFERRVA